MCTGVAVREHLQSGKSDNVQLQNSNLMRDSHCYNFKHSGTVSKVSFLRDIHINITSWAMSSFRFK